MFINHCIGQNPTEQSFLANTLRLRVCYRLSSHPDRIVGDEYLGMRQVDDPQSPFEHMVPSSFQGPQLTIPLF
jgi:hypothetical protein